MQGAWTPSLFPTHSPMLFTAALKGCAAASSPLQHHAVVPLHPWVAVPLPCAPCLPPPVSPILSLSQTCFNSRLQPLPASLHPCLPVCSSSCSPRHVPPSPPPCSLRTCSSTAVCLLCCSHAGLDYCARYWCRAPVVTQRPIGGANELRRQREKL